MELVLTIIFIAILFFCVKKKIPLIPTMVLVAFLILLYQLILGTPQAPTTPSGNSFIDMFEWYFEKCCANFKSVGLPSIAVLAYTNIMSDLRASDKLAYYLVRLTRPIKNKYVLVGIVMFIGILMKCPIPVGPAMLALMIQLFLPVLKQRGVSDLTCAPTLQLGSFVSYGPAEPAFVMCAGLVGIAEYDLFDWFVTMQLPMSLFIGIVAAVILAISSASFDKRDVAKGRIAAPTDEVYPVDEELRQLPGLLAVMPLIPIVVLVAMGMSSNLVYTVPAAIILSVVICMAVYLIATRNVKGLLIIIESYVRGLGDHFKGVGLIITTAVTFSNALSSLGGMTLLGNWMQSLDMSPFLLVLILCLVSCFAVVFLGSLYGSYGVFLPIAGIVATAKGLNPLFMGFIVMQACSCGAMMCPYNAVPAMINGALGVDSVQAMKRNAVPCIISLIASVIVGYFLYC